MNTQHKVGEAKAPGRAAQAAVRREQLLSTALALFSEHGYAATSTRRIAEAAGVTEGLVFHYFGTKDALLLELMARQTTFAGRVLALVQKAAEGSARELFAAVATGFAEVSAEEAACIGFFAAEAQINPSLRTQLAAGTAFVLEGFVQLLARGITSGELRPEASLSVAAHGFFGGFSFFFAQHRDLGVAAWRREAAAFAEAWADQCWRGLASPRSLSERSTSRPKPSRRSPR